LLRRCVALALVGLIGWIATGPPLAGAQGPEGTATPAQPQATATAAPSPGAAATTQPQPAAGAGQSQTTPVAGQPQATTISQYVRDQGHTLTADEAAFFDADEVIQAVYTQALVNIELLARAETVPQTEEWAQSVARNLELLMALDPTAAPPAPPSLQRLRELAVEQRQHYRAAATQWWQAFQADARDWRERGMAEQGAGLQVLYAWQAEFAARYPRAEGPR
jgi:hypothetical protein